MSRPRLLALGALLASLTAWGALAGGLPALDDPWDVALSALVLIPASFATAWLALPLATSRHLAALAAGLAAVAVALHVAGAGAAFDVAKLAALTLAGLWFLTLFEALSWVVLVAVVVPWVDVLSVYRGPTKVVVEQEPGLFERIAIGFRLPGEESGAQLGPPDVLFFALFLGTAARFGLRVGWTWLGMTTALGATLAATYVFELGGLPALPALSLGFLLPNADLVWRDVRSRLRARSRRTS